jgi:hypothetical protein
MPKVFLEKLAYTGEKEIEKLNNCLFTDRQQKSKSNYK